MKERYNILCSTDDNYVPYCGIMLTSLFENNKELDIEVYLMCESLNEKNLDDLNQLSKKYRVNIQIVKMDNTIFKYCPIRPNDHVSLVTYYRLVAADVLPEHIDKVLYLDCDMIVNSNISGLYNQDMEGCPIAMSKDETFFTEEIYERLNYNKKYTYGNAGVALINIKHWREYNITNKCLEYIVTHPQEVLFHDQDTLNAVLHKKMKLLPIKYNLQTGFLLSHYTQFYKNEMEEIMEAAVSPVIIHFTGVSKPWYKGSRHPYRKRFMHYKNISLWKAHPLKKNKSSLYERIIRLRNEVIWALGIMKRPKSYIIDKLK